MNLMLSPEIQQYIASQIAQGAYRDENELLTEAVQVLRLRHEKAEKRARLVADLELGIRSLDQGGGKATTAKQILADIT